MIEITEHPDGIILRIRASPGSRRTEITGEHSGALKVAVTARAIDGKANKAVLALLRDSFKLKRSQIELLAGETSRDKKVLIHGLGASQLRATLASLPLD